MHSDAERATLGEIGHRLGRKVLAEVATVARPDTILASAFCVGAVALAVVHGSGGDVVAQACNANFPFVACMATP